MNGANQGDPVYPIARRTQVLVEEISDGLLLYDLTTNKAHSLNRTAALVWRKCDGTLSIPDLARVVTDELELPYDEDLTWLAVTRLKAARLLRMSGTPPCSRRELLKRLSRAGIAMVLLPAVTSIMAATPASAASTDIRVQFIVLRNITGGGGGNTTLTMTVTGPNGFICQLIDNNGSTTCSFTFLAAHSLSITASVGGGSFESYNNAAGGGTNCNGSTVPVCTFVMPNNNDTIRANFN